jgi:hypothetical protein
VRTETWENIIPNMRIVVRMAPPERYAAAIPITPINNKNKAVGVIGIVHKILISELHTRS